MTIKIEFVFWRALGIGGRGETCPKTLFFLGGGGGECNDLFAGSCSACVFFWGGWALLASISD